MKINKSRCIKNGFVMEFGPATLHFTRLDLEELRDEINRVLESTE